MSNYKKDNMSYDPKYANWNKFYDDLQEEITKIREIGNTVPFDTDNTGGKILIYFTRIDNFYSTHKHFLMREDDLGDILEQAQTFLFGKQFLKNPTNYKDAKMKYYNKLKSVFSEMCGDFSRNGISVKVSGKKKRNPKEAILEGYD